MRSCAPQVTALVKYSARDARGNDMHQSVAQQQVETAALVSFGETLFSSSAE